MSQPSAPNLEDLASNGGEVEMQTLLCLPGTRCFTINQGERALLGHGELNICLMDDKTLLLYVPNVFHYAITKQFPSLKASTHSFVFPGHNMCFGIIIPASVPLDDIDMFEGLLSEFSQYQIDEELQDQLRKSADKDSDEKTKDEKYTEKGKMVASYIKKGTDLASRGIKKTTSVASLGIKKSNEFIKKQIKTRKQVDVSEKTKGRIQKAKIVSKGAVKVTKSIAIGAKVLCSELAAAASDAASKTEMGRKFSTSQSGKVQAFKDVGKATIVGTLTIIDELHNAAVILVAEIADSSADLAGYKYGDQVGDAAQEIATVVKDGSHVVKNVHELGWKQMAQTMAGQGAIDVMSTEEEKVKQRTERRLQDLQGVDPNVQTAATMASAMTINSVMQQQSPPKYNM